MRVSRPRVPLVYRMVMIVATPVVRWWGRMTVTGAELLDHAGPLLALLNHDTHWDPLVVGVAGHRRQVRALAKSSLWNIRGLRWVLDQMGQIPLERGRADTAALTAAIEALEHGECVGVFPEGRISCGVEQRPLSGAGRLALAVPNARIVAVAVTGAVDIVRFPKRPRIHVEFFEPTGGQAQPGESAIKLTRRIMAEVRAKAPYAPAGRDPDAVRARMLSRSES